MSILILLCVPVLCDCCYSSDHNAKSCPHVTFIDSRIGQIKYKIKSNKESMENMIRTLMDQFSQFVKGYIESTMPVSHDTNLRAKPTTLEDCLLGNLETPYPLSS